MSNSIHAAVAAAAAQTPSEPISTPGGKESSKSEPFKLGPAVTLSLSNTKALGPVPAKVNDAAQGDPDGDGH